ncbi:hypothetical protein Tco_1479568, partial [Tanacetum coccineum]
IISITKEKQQALDDALVLREQRLTIGSCNYRLSTTFKPKEPTFQVALDVLSLSLTPFYPAFLITASVPTIYMQEFWATVTYQKHHIRFKINKKCHSFDMDTLRNMLQIYGAILPDYLTNPAMKESEAYKTYHDLATKKLQPKPKYGSRSSRTKTDEGPKPSSDKRVKATAKVAKSGKKKQPAPGLETLSDIALTKAEQMKLAIKRSKTQLHIS